MIGRPMTERQWRRVAAGLSAGSRLFQVLALAAAAALVFQLKGGVSAEPAGPVVPQLPAAALAPFSAPAPAPVRLSLTPMAVAPAAARPEPEKLAALPAKWPDLSLKGLMLGDSPTAYLEDKPLNRTFKVKQGDALGPVQIRSIEPGKVVIEENGETHELRL